VKSECAPEESVLPEKKQRRKRSDDGVLLGGISPANTSDPYITRIADFAVSELDRGTNSLYAQCIVKIVSASTQVCIWREFVVSAGMSHNFRWLTFSRLMTCIYVVPHR
jgi:hypothetical protein